MKRIVLACWGSHGDLFPYLGLARLLQARGHVPVVATCPFYRDLVRAEGVEFHPLRPDADPTDTSLLRRALDPLRGSEVVVRELAVPAIRDAYADLSDAARGADLLVTHPIAFAGPLVAETLRLPWVSTVLAPLSFFSVYDFPALPPVPLAVHLGRLGPWAARGFLAFAKRMTRTWTEPVRALRTELGLPPAGDPLYEGQFSPFGTLALYSRVLGDPQPDWPPNTHVTGFVFYKNPREMPADVARFLDAGEPPIVFTLGSSAVGAAGTFYEESSKAAAALGRRAVLLVGPHPANRPSGAKRKDVCVAEYAPHDALFARAAAVVHHGGIGTTGQVLRAGRPMLVVPHAHDQPDNAFRVRRLKVARVLDARRYTGARAASHLKTLLDEPAYRDRAAEIGRTIGAEQGTERACEVLMSCVAGSSRGAVR